MNEARAVAHRMFIDTVREAVANGISVPCVEDPGGGWTSENPQEQERAGALCAACPLLEDCRGYVETHSEAGAVWAGKVRRPQGRERTLARLAERRRNLVSQ